MSITPKCMLLSTQGVQPIALALVIIAGFIGMQYGLFQ